MRLTAKVYPVIDLHTTMNMINLLRAMERARKHIAPGQMFEHYRGGIYRVDDIAISEKSHRVVVIYTSVELGIKWTRTFDSFIQDVELPDGTIEQRFRACRQDDDDFNYNPYEKD